MSYFYIKNLKNLFLIIGFLPFFILNSVFANTFDKNLKVNATLSKLQDSIYHTEKVFLHFDKPYYSSGEMMWFKTYLVSANTNKPDAKSKIVHVELIDPFNKIINSRSIKIKDGGGEGEFYLPKRLNQGEYTIRAYTNFMQNFDQSYFFLRKINIGNAQSLVKDQNLFIKNKQKKLTADQKPDIQFFPEGGYIVTNKTSNLGFKPIDYNGKSIDVSGSILDSNDTQVSTFKTVKFGLGKFELTPKKDELYKAVIEYKGNNYTYDLPKALDKGVTMEVTEHDSEYQVLLQSSLSRGVHRLTLTGLQNGEIITVSQLTGSYKVGVINVPKSYLKQGIVQFTISDKNKQPLCERLIFVETDKFEPTVTITSAKAEYKKRELIELDFELDSIIQTNMSLAVTDVEVVEPEKYGLDIRSHLLLNSELKGGIEQPGYYFHSKDPNRKMMLDLLMMTHGWRQFIWNHEDKNKKQFTHETGIRFKGVIKDHFNNKKTVSSEVSLTYMSKNEFVEDKTKSFENGKFQFGDYHFNDSTSIIIQAKNYKIKKRKKKDIEKLIMNYKIELDSFTSPTIDVKKSHLNKLDYLEFNNNFVNNDYLIRSKMIRLNSVVPFEDEFEKLDEVVIKHTRVKEEVKVKFKNRGIIYGQPTRRVDFDDIQTFDSNNVMAALRNRVPGLRMQGNIANPISYPDGSGGLVKNYQITFRGSPALILIDNFPAGDDFAGVYAEDVSFVDFLSPVRASIIFGSRAAGGAISIHTKRGNERLANFKRDRRGIINFIHPGYYKARKFYEPNYMVKKPEHKKFDYRTTIYWKPTLKLDEKSRATISFYAADIPTTYRIELQGISKEGQPITTETYVEVK